MTVELHPAFVWNCNACGRENFSKEVVLKMSHEEKLDLWDRHGCVQSDLSMEPMTVTCKQCKTEENTDVV